MSEDKDRNELIKSQGTDVSLGKDYLDEQFRLLAMFKLPETAAERYHVVVQKDGTKVLRKRENPIIIFDGDDSGRTACVRNVQKTYSERIGLDADHTGRGKYHDAGRLALEEAMSSGLEVGEVAEWATI